MATLMKTDGTCETVTSKSGKKKFTLEEMQALIGPGMGNDPLGMVEFVPGRFEKGRRMIANEEGLLLQMPLNRAASLLASAAGYGNPIVGPVVLVEKGEF